MVAEAARSTTTKAAPGPAVHTAAGGFAHGRVDVKAYDDALQQIQQLQPDDAVCDGLGS